MSAPAIRVENLGKRYRLGLTHAGSIRELASRVTDRLFGRKPPLLAHELARVNGNGQQVDEDGCFWALKDVSFEVQLGEVVGIIGRNGAGKSTLLKILSRITAPTQGRVEIIGRVASLLEVGTGFHPELTGRENVYLNGAILGMTKAEIRRKFDEIVAFAEIEKFIDTPVKRYSSGMYVRLAFAVAAHLEPEVLVIDEVLAVGDTAFQKKCLGKISALGREGRTVLFVSHNMAAVERLTHRTMVFQQGGLVFSGVTDRAIEWYNHVAEKCVFPTYEVENTPRYDASLKQQIQFLRLRLENRSGIVYPDQEIAMLLTVRANETVARFRFSLTIFRSDGMPVGSVFGAEKHTIKLGEQAIFRFAVVKHSLAPGTYYCGLSTGVGDHLTGHRDFDTVLEVLHFQVVPPEGTGGTLSYWTPGWGAIRFSEPTEARVWEASHAERS